METPWACDPSEANAKASDPKGVTPELSLETRVGSCMGRGKEVREATKVQISPLAEGQRMRVM